VLDRRAAAPQGSTWTAELTVPAEVPRGSRIAAAMVCSYGDDRCLVGTTEQVATRRFDAELAAELHLELIRWQHPEEGAILPKDRIWLRLAGLRDWPVTVEVAIHGKPLAAVLDPQWPPGLAGTAWRIDLPDVAEWTGADIVAQVTIASANGSERCELSARRGAALLGIDGISPARDVAPGGTIVAAVRGAPGLPFEYGLFAETDKLAGGPGQGTGKRQDLSLTVPTTAPRGTALRVRLRAMAPWGEVVTAEAAGPTVPA
jgi:hypothetical protein